MQVSKTISRRFRTLPPPPFLIKDLVLNNVFCFFLAVFFFFRCICICCRSSGVKGGNAKLPTAAQNCNERGIYSSPPAELYILFKLLLLNNWTLHSFLLLSNWTLYSFLLLINWTAHPSLNSKIPLSKQIGFKLQVALKERSLSFYSSTFISNVIWAKRWLRKEQALSFCGTILFSRFKHND